MKTLLIFIDWFVPGYKAGGPIRSVANLCEHLSAYFNIKIITADTDYLEKKPYKNIKSDCFVKYSENVEVYYISKNNLSVRVIKNIVKNTDFDIAYINGIYSFYFSIFPTFILRKSSKKIIIASRGMLSEHSFSGKGAKKRVFLKVAEKFKLYKNIIFHATNSQEKKDIDSIITNNGIFVIPNFAKKSSSQKLRKINKKQGELKLVSIARISVEKNTLFALRILSELKISGKITFDIFGSISNNEYWNECKKIIAGLDKQISVNYKGTIEQEKVHGTFEKYHFSFMPSIGENFGHSILESMSAGCPAIISKGTPWLGLEEKNAGWDIELEAPNKFVSCITDLINFDNDNYVKYAEGSYAYAKSVINDPKILKNALNLFSR